METGDSYTETIGIRSSAPTPPCLFCSIPHLHSVRLNFLDACTLVCFLFQLQREMNAWYVRLVDQMSYP